MAFTYQIAQLGTTPLYQLRLLLRDTVESGHRLEDEELAWVLSQAANLWLAAATAADLLLDRLETHGTVVSKSVDDLSISYDRSALLEQRRRWARLGAGHQVPFCGGISVGEGQVLRDDTDWKHPAFASERQACSPPETEA